MELSIIVPIYNGEKYIKRCIDSILKIKEIDYEIIVINDNSTDNSINILQNYANNNEKIKLIDLKENKGVSFCRNLGIQKSSGKYIGFIDIDDYIEEGMYEKLVSMANNENLEVCVCNYVEIEEEGKNNVKSKYKYDIRDANNQLAIKMYLTDKISPAVWDKIYKAEMVKGKIEFDETLQIGEDIAFILDCIILSNKIGFINNYYYNYIQQNKSAMHSISDKLLQFIKITQKVKNEKKYTILKEKYIHELEYFSGEMITRSIHSISNNISSNNKREARNYLKQIVNENRKELIQFVRNRYTSKAIKIELIILLKLGTNAHIMLFPIYKFIRNRKRK